MAQADSSPTTRRTFLGQATAVALSTQHAAAAPVQRAAAGPTPAAALDPVFAAIEMHRRAYRALEDAAKINSALERLLPASQRQGDMNDLVKSDDPRWTANMRALDAANDALDDCADRLLDTRPASLDGLCAVLRYAHEYVSLGNEWPNDYVREDSPGSTIGMCFSVLLNLRAADAIAALTARA